VKHEIMNKLSPALTPLIVLVLAGSFCHAQTSPQEAVSRNVSPEEARASGAKQEKATLKPGSQRYPRYELRAGDVLDITFEFTPEFNQAVPIQPDGFITLRDVGDIQVGGLTLPELTQTIRTAYSRILKDPTIAIFLKDFEKPYFIASGEVARPGKYDLRGDMTVVEAIAIAGGFVKESAKHSQVLLYRRVSRDWMQGRVLDVKKMMHDKDLSEDMHIKPGDMVIVPQNRLSKFERFLPIPRAGVNLSTVP
jgi:polysaccharide biosynthesis/export protein